MKIVIFAHSVEKYFNDKKVAQSLLSIFACPLSKGIYSLVSDNNLTNTVSLFNNFKSSTILVSNYLRTFDKSLFHTFSKTYYDYIKKNNEAKLPHFSASWTDNLVMNHLSFQKTVSIANTLTESFTGNTIKNTSIMQKSLKRNGGLVKFVLIRQ
ncbi:hypothetical protein [Emticicia sp. SJ17W-69]|uniref:hypothetical protein n=1 Tax=Emticicia sp. SJ17W-69 TaxID=3421657 RepID=UPI003EB887F8